ncbi:T9SS type A sorting domain-containing protein [uncultured Algibacter sp.]|uniref:T9SS type A sorting domain-containing protein n=1 Tax=uncultured Algibacter sp. TaxID=298659 RepID=UPI002626B53C|nr:T9SS type A sorting domain-containing protein [uncultured Algibacter sp.]
MKKLLLSIAFLFAISIGTSAQTNVALGKTVTIVPTTANPTVFMHSTTDPQGITNGSTGDTNADRWLYNFGAYPISESDPIAFEVDFGAPTEIDSYRLTEKQDASSYTFETWNGASWDIQNTVVGSAGGANAISTGCFMAVTTTKVRVVITSNPDTNNGGSNKFIRVHELEVFAPFAEDVNIISTSIGVLGASDITAIPGGTSANDLIAALTLNIGVTATVLNDADDSEVLGGTPVANDMFIRVSACNETPKDYDIVVSTSATNVALGKTVTIIPTTANPGVLAHSTTKPSSITDGVRQGSGDDRWLYNFGANAISALDPIIFEVDLVTPTEIDSYTLFERQDGSEYTFETLAGDGVTWVQQASFSGTFNVADVRTSACFDPVTTTKVRVVITGNPDDNGGSGTNRFIRVHELELYAPFTEDVGIISTSLGILGATDITDIPSGTTAVQLIAALELELGNTAVVLNDADDSLAVGGDPVTNDMFVRVSACNETPKDYDIALSSIYNVAEGSAVTIVGSNSYTHHLTNIPANAVDGDSSSSTRWLYRFDDVTNGDGLPVEFVMDLGADFDIESYALYEPAGDQTTDYTFQYLSGDGVTWMDLIMVTGNTDATSSGAFTSGTVTTNKVKVIFISSADTQFIRLHEVQVFGAPAKTTGVDDLANSKFSVFPNPVRNILNVATSNSAVAKIEVYSILGKKVLEIKNSDAINVSALARGVYISKIYGNNNSVSTKRFVKQ